MAIVKKTTTVVAKPAAKKEPTFSQTIKSKIKQGTAYEMARNIKNELVKPAVKAVKAKYNENFGSVAKPAMKASPRKPYNQDSLKAEVSYRVAQNLAEKAGSEENSASGKSLVSKKWSDKGYKKAEILRKESGKALSTFNKLTNTTPSDVRWMRTGPIQTPDAEKAIKAKFGKKK
jgi:hypothetical protein